MSYVLYICMLVCVSVMCVKFVTCVRACTVYKFSCPVQYTDVCKTTGSFVITCSCSNHNVITAES